MKNCILILLTAVMFTGCANERELQENGGQRDVPFIWNNANIYFLLTDRFNNGDPGNDVNFGRTDPAAVNRGFMGGDLAGVTKKIEEGYFNKLGISAIWLTPFYEQIHGMVDEGTGDTYAYHGYWTRDWTALDPNFGTPEELDALVEAARDKGIRIIMDVIINHTGPVTENDPVWGDAWVRTEPRCTYEGYASTIQCTLVDNLPDIRTGKMDAVPLPDVLVEKWKNEGRYEKEMEELDAFFGRTGYPRAPRYYLIKWITDYIRKYGINGYRLDTAKHTEEDVWSDLRKEADIAYAEWKAANPGVVPEEEPFYMVGEVYNYVISGGKWFDFGDTVVNFYAEGIDHLINFEFKYDAQNHYELVFSKYSEILNSALRGNGVLNYLSSHDDGDPYDKMRERPFEAATKLLLSPGAAQVYYGDETSRLLFTPGAEGDANLRSFMNWEKLEEDAEVNGTLVSDVLYHYRKLGQFRRNHPAVGAGVHRMIATEPYTFSRTWEKAGYTDRVVVALDLDGNAVEIDVEGIFDEGAELTDFYSGETTNVKNGKAIIRTEYPVVLLEEKI